MGLLSFGRKHCCEDNGDVCVRRKLFECLQIVLHIGKRFIF